MKPIVIQPPKGIRLNTSMECPFCKSTKSQVTDKRNYLNRILRRRWCENGHRYSTLEVVGEQDKTSASTPIKIVNQPGVTDYSYIEDINKLKKTLPISIDKEKLKNIIFPISADAVINSLDDIIDYKELIKNLHNL